MAHTDIHADDIGTLADMLEHEKRSHHSKRSWCFAMFIASLALLIVGLLAAAVMLGTVIVSADDSVTLGAKQMLMVQILAPVGATAVGLFSLWWTVQNCINSIDRALFAARANRPGLFVGRQGVAFGADR